MIKQKITYSALSKFINCRKAYQLRYEKKLVPIERTEALFFGTVIHDCLELWHSHYEQSMVFDYINKTSALESYDYNLAIAMMKGYFLKYPTESFNIIDLEHKFKGRIINPLTGRASQSFDMEGKVDGIVEENNEYFLMEHKTAALVNGTYLEKLWTDFQITLYSHYIEQEIGIKISGVIYNILEKVKLKQSEGETESAFEIRKAEAIAKSKNGKTGIKRQMPETDKEYQDRLFKKYKDGSKFTRELIIIDDQKLQNVQHEVWELTQQLLDCKRRGVYYKNPGNCFNYNRACEYYKICSSNDNPIVIENNYFYKDAHEELG